MRLKSPFFNLAITRLLPLAVVSLGLAFAAACGGDDNGTSTPTSAVSIGASVSSGSSTPQSSGAVSGTPAPTALECTSSAADAGLISQVSFSTPAGKFTAGQAIDITLILADCGDNEAVLHFPTSQRYDFIINDPNGAEVWRSSDGKSYDQVEGTETLQAGQTKLYKETWDQKDRSGNQVLEGKYKVSAFSVGCGVEARAGCQFGPVGYVEIQPALSSTPST